MKLKTLKDLTWTDEIKEEAIKWIKDMKGFDGLCITAEQFAKKFFNITEEDLK